MYNATKLYYLLLGATHYLENNAGMEMKSNELNKNPKIIDDMHFMIGLAFAEHRTGNNETDGLAKNVRGSRNNNGTYDHGLWQINLNQANYTYLTSQQPSNGVNSNIPMFKGLSKRELKDLLYDPGANAIAALAIVQLTAGGDKYSGINNWSTGKLVNTNSAYYSEAKKDLTNHLGATEWVNAKMDKKITESFQTIPTFQPPVTPPDNDTEFINNETNRITMNTDYSNLNFLETAVAKTIGTGYDVFKTTKGYFNKVKENLDKPFIGDALLKQIDFMESKYNER